MQQPIEQTTLFEVSWEVCNKVGGIYTVVSTKVPQATKTFGDNYYLIGPDLGNNADFQETDEPCWEALSQSLAIRSLHCRFGRWNIPGNPKVILVGFKDRYNQNQLLYEFWNRYGVDSMTGGWDYIEPVMFGAACGEIINIAIKTLVEPVGGKAVAHFHEWMCGSGLLTIKQLAPDVGTVFTTHATILGRSMAGAGIDIYENLSQINPQREAAAYNITAKHSMESITAREADYFTTVSEITANEAEALLGRRPDIITPNGLDLHLITDFSKDPSLTATARKSILDRVSQFISQQLPNNTRIMIISGRYEFHNKGFDVFIDALGSVEQTLRNSSTYVLALCTAIGGHTGITKYALENHLESNMINPPTPLRISTHHAYNIEQDPIIAKCLRLGLTNHEENHVKVIFVPALLNGQDGFFNMQYEQVLSGCDLGVFPSWYEPWGYTPQESAAHAVPTVTTDLSGFGMWVRKLQETNHTTDGISIIHRLHMPYNDTVNALQSVMLEYATCSEEVLTQHRIAVRKVSEECSWEKFFPYYIQSYHSALTKANERISIHEPPKQTNTLLITGVSKTPYLRMFTAINQLPPKLERLREISNNVWWSWQPEAEKIFILLNKELWKQSGHNPLKMFEDICPASLMAAEKNDEIQKYYNELVTKFDEYMKKKPHTSDPSISSYHPIAYFSTEYGLHESIPLYSGGLGILSGDHLKAASDLNIPMVAIGLLYKNGYFQQRIDAQGNQIAMYPENNLSLLPISLVKTVQGDPIRIELDLFPGRQLFAQVWKMQVGHVPLYLLDTDIPQNILDDRRITARLYESDRDCRIRQEILLGMGGVRLLNLLKIMPSIYHMNEGHSAFMILERIRNLMLWFNLSFQTAQECVRGNTVFTTHTPVDAGNERFEPALMEKYFSDYAKSVNLTWNDFMNLGRYSTTDRNMFEMTLLAIRNAVKVNGVSRLHSQVSKHMWANNWKGLPIPEVPIGYVTNGVHVASYVGDHTRKLLKKYVHELWDTLPTSHEAWKNIVQIPNEELWEAKVKQKQPLLNVIKHLAVSSKFSYKIFSEEQQSVIQQLSEDVLIIGFARRFAPYKRANLILANPDRLHRILNNPQQPTILVFSGKAHPADQQGIDLIKQVISYTKDPRFYGKIFFIENYNIAIAKILLQGCDVWLNTPRRPYEACGTSGQKISANGGLNLSIADGWWCEGYNGHNGWTIGKKVGDILPESEQCDYGDAESLYNLLEESVLPLYFKKNINSFSISWMEMVKNAMQSLIPEFNAERMLHQYLDEYYLPLAKNQVQFRGDNFTIPKQITAWKQGLEQRFATIKIRNVQIEGLTEDTVLYGEPLTITVTLSPESMKVDELLVQFIIGPGKDNTFTEMPDVVTLTVSQQSNTEVTFSGVYNIRYNGPNVYGIRILTTMPGLLSPYETGLILWL